MAAKFLPSLTKDNQDLQKKIICMTCIVQLYDLQSMLASRHLIGNNLKRLVFGNISLCQILIYHTTSLYSVCTFSFIDNI